MPAVRIVSTTDSTFVPGIRGLSFGILGFDSEGRSVDIGDPDLDP